MDHPARAEGAVNCDGVREAAPAWRAGKLEPARAAEVDAHVDACPACQTAHERFEALFAGLPVRQVDLAGAFRKRLAGLETRVPGRAPVAPPPPPPGSVLRYVAPMLALALAFLFLRPAAVPLTDPRAGVWTGAGRQLAVGQELRAPASLKLGDPAGNLALTLGDGTHLRRTAEGVELLDGAVGLSIAKGSSPGFTVRAGAAAVRVSGTRFTVKRGGTGVRVELVDGSTYVSQGGPERRMMPGEVLELDGAGAVRVSWLSKDELARVAAWLK